MGDYKTNYYKGWFIQCGDFKKPTFEIVYFVSIQLEFV